MNDTNPAAPLFQTGQRVRILPNKNYPPTKAPGGIRYGIIQGKTQHPGMNLMNVQLPNGNNGTNAKGEWAYIVASYHSPNAGAMWFTAAGLQPMKRGAEMKNQKIQFSFPCNTKHGPFTVVGTATAMETAEENALWHYNSAIAHDGFSPVARFPKDTTQKIIEDI